MALALLLSFLLLGTYTECAAPSGPWDAFNFAPESRTVYPRSVRETHGNITDAENVLSSGSVTISGDGSYVALDFGYEVRSSTFALTSDVTHPRMPPRAGSRDSLLELRRRIGERIDRPFLDRVAALHKPTHVRRLRHRFSQLVL